MLTDTQIERYSRQIILPEVGARGQQALLAAAVGIVARGHLGDTLALYLAAAGVGRLGIVAADGTDGNALAALNPDCDVQHLPDPATAAGASQLAGTHDVVIAGNAPADTCAQLNRACVAHGRPFIWASTGAAAGCMSTFSSRIAAAPCYHCGRAQLPVIASAAAEAEALSSVTAAFVGTLQAMEALKIILGLPPSVAGRAWVFDAVDGTLRDAPLRADPACTVCGTVRSNSAVAG
jgi:molybdopterin-synthase adenylyltransferase